MIEALHQGRQVYGTVIASTSPKSIEGLVGLDLDCVMLDTEHIPMLWDDLGWLCRTYRSMGIVPLVRIPRADPFEACRALDMGVPPLPVPTSSMCVENQAASNWLASMPASAIAST